MKLGVFTALFADRTLDDVLEYATSLGLDTLEIGTGNYPGNPHCPIDDLLRKPSELKEWKQKFEDKGIEISALSCHGNALHPDPKFALQNVETLKKTIKLAGKLGIETVIDFSGCPGDSDDAKAPNWVTCPWPPDFTDVVEWQWEKKVIPFWKRMAKTAAKEGVKLAFEMHPGFVVYNTETMLRLRHECGDNIGANFDPSHLFWQGMDPIASLRELKDCIFHVHGKDTAVEPYNVAKNGVLDTKDYGNIAERSWVFRTIGYGHGPEWWAKFISALRTYGYDGVISIEHEDGLMSIEEGLEKAVALLQNLLMKEDMPEMWWA